MVCGQKNKIYIAGKITGSRFYKIKFKLCELYFRLKGYVVLNPAKLPKGMEHDDYMWICYSMIDVANEVYFMPCWEKSKGAKMEYEYCKGERLDVVQPKLMEYKVIDIKKDEYGLIIYIDGKYYTGMFEDVGNAQ